VQEIEAHARHYSQAYNSPKSKWNDPYERPKMERKTVLVNGLRKWGRFNQEDTDLINEIESEQGYVDRGELPDESEVTPPVKVEKTPEQIKRELGIDPDPAPEKPEPQKPTEPEPAKTPDPKPTRPYDPETLKAKLTARATTFAGKKANGSRNQVAACLNHILGGDGPRKELQVFLFGQASLSDVSDELVLAAHEWLKPAYDQNQGVFLADEIAAKEANAAHVFSQKTNGQQELPIQ
jgi:hypothetical protein